MLALINNDEPWGTITRHADVNVLTLYAKREGAWSLPLDDAIATVKVAAVVRLRALERPVD